MIGSNTTCLVCEQTHEGECPASEVIFPAKLGLTPREKHIIMFILAAYSNRDIGKELIISEETVKRHMSNIFDKVGVSTRLELMTRFLSVTLTHKNTLLQEEIIRLRHDNEKLQSQIRREFWTNIGTERVQLTT